MKEARVAGVILAGGLARRMGGGDKTLLPLAGRPLLAHAVERLRPNVGALAVSANGDPARFSAFGLPVIADTMPDYPGPLAGVLAGVKWAAECGGVDHIVTVAGDTPFFPADFATQLLAAGAGRADTIAVAASAGRRHPVFALWPVALAGDLEAFLREGETFRVAAFIARHRAVTRDFPVAGSDPFFNVNTPADLAAAEKLFAGATG